MGLSQWSRSRYWLGHFMYRRHERPAVDWDQSQRPVPHPLAYWLASCTQGTRRSRDQRMIQNAVKVYAHDPAYIQAQRLVARECEYHRQLIERLLARPQTQMRPRSRKIVLAMVAIGQSALGSRFALSIRLFDDLVDLVWLRLVQTAGLDRRDTALHGICQNLIRDKQAQLAFGTERLTLLYTDFNFIRRNLRRLRLRLMWAGLLLGAAVRHGQLVKLCGSSRQRFIAQGWRQFSGLLERVVPYRRDTLLAILVNQRQNPYGDPPLSEHKRIKA